MIRLSSRILNQKQQSTIKQALKEIPSKKSQVTINNKNLQYLNTKKEVTTRNAELNQILDRFPKTTFALAYGSGAFQQASYQKKSRNMLDLILVVENLDEFHTLNMQRNPTDYHFIARKFIGPEKLDEYQKSIGNHIWWHPYIKNAIPSNKSQELKYGIIEYDHFKDDMVNWSDLYVAGRLHKPVKKLFRDKNYQEKIENLIHNNRMQALNTALLTLPESFTERELYLEDIFPIANIEMDNL